MELTSTDTRAYTTAGILAAGSGVFAWGIGIIIIKLTTSPFLVVALYRHLFALPVLLIAWSLTRNRTLPWRAAGLGGVLFAAHQVAHFGALRYTTAAVVTILFSLQPLLVGALGRRVTGERVPARFYPWAVVAVIGCGILVLGSSDHPNATPLGTVLAVLNLLAWSAYFLATKRARATVGTTSWLLVMTLVSSGCIAVLTLATRQPLGAPDGTELTYILLLALVPATLGHYLVTWAHPRMHAAASSALVLGVPIIATIGAAMFAGEAFGAAQALGTLIALTGSALAIRRLPALAQTEVAITFGKAEA